jgi:hypothetical protein
VLPTDGGVSVGKVVSSLSRITMCAFFLLLFMATHGTASVAEPEEFPFGFFNASQSMS